MTDDIDALIQETPAETKAWFKQQVRTHGLRAAYRALVGVCEDPKAAAPAKATSAGFLLRAAGVLEKTEELDDKDPSTMTRAEMMEEYARLSREADEAERVSLAADTAPPRRKQNVFG